MDQEEEGAGLLYGVPAIASYLGLSPRQVYHLKDAGGLPTFPLRGKICARRSTLSGWLKAQEAAAIAS